MASLAARSAIASGRPSLSSRRSHRAVLVRAAIDEGATVKVVKPVTIFHAPKHAEGVALEGMTGTVVKNVAEYKGQTLSANLQYKVAFQLEKDGATVKVQAHLVSLFGVCVFDRGVDGAPPPRAACIRAKRRQRARQTPNAAPISPPPTRRAGGGGAAGRLNK